MFSYLYIANSEFIDDGDGKKVLPLILLEPKSAIEMSVYGCMGVPVLL